MPIYKEFQNENKKGIKNVFKEIMAEDFPNLKEKRCPVTERTEGSK